MLKHLRISNKSELVTNYLINCFQLNLHIKINKIHKISMIIDSCEQQWVIIAKVRLKCDVKWYVPPCVRIHPDKNITYHLIDFYQIWIIVCRCWKILRILLSHIQILIELSNIWYNYHFYLRFLCLKNFHISSHRGTLHYRKL